MWFLATVCRTVRPMLSVCCLPVCDCGPSCGQTDGWIKKKLGMEVGLGPGDIVLHGDPSPPQKRGDSSPHFSAHVLWPDGWMDQDASWYGRRPQPRPHRVRWGPSTPQKGHSPQIFGRVYCGQMVAWIEMPLGMKIGVGPGNIVLDGDPTPPEMRHSPPNFRLMSVVAKRLV